MREVHERELTGGGREECTSSGKCIGSVEECALVGWGGGDGV